ncbi:MAG: transposase [Phycisphaeraceae bacterium]|nr:transposase [Phycisphaerales bacterium]MCB9843134.1 transposase [Phycisphaeraceae bacterium]
MSQVLAYFLTWTCYGTWHRGDERGSIDREHQHPGTDTARPSEVRVLVNTARMKGEPVTLTPQDREVADRTIRDHCEHRGWTLLALNARSNHVHVVVRCDNDTPPERAMSEFKAWSTRRLREHDDRFIETQVWTEHGSTRWIKDTNSLRLAIEYVEEHQDR